MSDKQYLESILSLCTPKQRKLFERMYPYGVKDEQTKQAITQVENTINALNCKNEEFRDLQIAFNAFKNDVHKKENLAASTIAELEQTIKTLHESISHDQLDSWRTNLDKHRNNTPSD